MGDFFPSKSALSSSNILPDCYDFYEDYKSGNYNVATFDKKKINIQRRYISTRH